MVMIASRAPSSTISRTAMQAVLVVVELVADELLGLELVGRDHVGLGAHGAAQRLAVGVDHASSRRALRSSRISRA